MRFFFFFFNLHTTHFSVLQVIASAIAAYCDDCLQFSIFIVDSYKVKLVQIYPRPSPMMSIVKKQTTKNKTKTNQNEKTKKKKKQKNKKTKTKTKTNQNETKKKKKKSKKTKKQKQKQKQKKTVGSITRDG